MGQSATVLRGKSNVCAADPHNSAFLPSSPLNSIVATLDEITEGKKAWYSQFVLRCRGVRMFAITVI